MPVTWTISHPTRLVVALAKGEVGLKDIEAYLDAVMVAEALPYRKLFDTTAASIALSDTEMMTLGARIRAYIALGPIGPLAIAATSDESYWQARMFAVLAEADRPVKIFRKLSTARDWLEGQPPGGTAHLQPPASNDT
ncbi:MAG: hypothetical protein GEV13_29335 [Rhodospirillales bacterium]|nr:hypothetical protein [Rhodospirillales bacterium]